MAAYRAVLATLNARYIHASLAPWCLLAGLRTFCREPIEAAVIEGTINEKSEAVAERILAARPSLVAFSVYIWNRDETLAVIERIKNAFPETVVVCGGPEVAYIPACFLREHPKVDFILCGEGEEPIARLADALAAGREPATVPGLCRRVGKELLQNPIAPPLPLPPTPYCTDYFAVLSGRIAYLETSRGCPFSCAFCLSGGEGGVRFYPLDRVERELLLLASAGCKTVKLVDRTFNADRARARRIWRFLIEHYEQVKGVCFHFEVAGDLLTEEDLSLLQRAPRGLFRLEIGIQSFRAETLAAVARKSDTDALCRTLSALTAAGNLSLHIDLIAGLPGEDEPSFLAGLDRAYRLGAQMLQVGFLKLLHGSAMRTHPEAFPCEYTDAPPYEVRATAALPAAGLSRLRAAADAVDRLYNSGRYRRTLAYLTDAVGLAPSSIFVGFGAQTHGHQLSADACAERFFAFASALPGVETRALRDAMVSDRLITNSASGIPKTLLVADPSYAKVKKTLRESAAFRGCAVKRSAAILYTKGAVLLVEYRDRDPVSGEYPHRLIPLSVFTEER